MLYKSDGNIWDNLVIEDDKGLFHNFYLMLNGCLGHIVSRDLVHWEPRPVLDFHVPGTWCENGENLTGSVVRVQAENITTDCIILAKMVDILHKIE